MKIVSSILPSEKIQSKIKSDYPKVNFEFYKGMKNAEESFYDAEVFLTYGEDLTPDHIEKAKNLKWIMVMSAGMEKMPFDACREKGILVTNVRGVHKIPMAEYTMGMMLHHAKQVSSMLANEQEEIWERIPKAELCDQTILILGVGAIGGEIARLAKAFRMHTLGVNSSGNQVDHIDEIYSLAHLNQILTRADYVVSVLPSTNETKGLLTEEHFKWMKDTAVFINIGRGDLISEEVLLTSMEKKHIAHAFLDVFSQEPLPKGHPFWKMENVTVTPHVSSITKKYLPRSFEIFNHNLHTYINKGNKFINKINLERGY
ncbi:D-2-hydroxyacid dehydrogenase [Bacillus sp. 31A1R]|uniref:D-2-hydroxyacid dehydrogenase n=1 Tax=Robertmurraya mangrovi TaxID=3098077 RepID=A0ABU5J588_9BACI|nr:D-2-hydroxyacid dehydrogenase [Bacillus sp. 31A1R]MDZ5474536.1 D-2-hydroxyacid dehydrogenase [Bacillus sp. 31A1R]